MDLYINADPRGVITRKQIEDIGFKGMRTTVLPGTEQPIINCMIGSPLKRLYVLDYDAQELAKLIVVRGYPKLSAIELVNEPNLNGWKPEVWADWMVSQYQRIKTISPDITVVSGGISNLNRAQLKYLKTALAVGLPDDLVIGYHRYQTEKPSTSALKDYKTRSSEYYELVEVIGNRRRWCTEIGWHTQPQTIRYGPFGLFSKRVQWNDKQVANFLEDELIYQDEYRAEVTAIYQIIDGPSNHYEDHFGIFRMDGTMKEQAYRIRDIQSAVA